MKVYDVVQRSPEWKDLRLGRLTSTCAAPMLATRKDKQEAADRRNLRLRLVLERITNRTQESTYVSSAMQQGQDREADARVLYEAITGRLLTSVGFVAHDSLMAGCSPDGIVGHFEGLVEAKCPLASTHLSYVRSGRVPEEYYHQVTHQLWITGARWCDWISYCPDFPEPLQMRMVRIDRVEEAMKAYELIVRQFLAEVDRDHAEILALVQAVPA